MEEDTTERAPTHRAQVIARVLLGPYLVALGLVVFLPAHDAERVTGIVAMAADLLAAIGVPREPAVAGLEFLANIALFVPFGVLVRTAFPNTTGPVVLVGGFALSVGIELVQIAIPSRVPAVSDVIANTIGVGVGVGIVVLGSRRRERDPERHPTGRQ